MIDTHDSGACYSPNLDSSLFRDAMEVFHINTARIPCREAFRKKSLHSCDIEQAEQRLIRFAPFICRIFPETLPTNGIIESPLIPAQRLLGAVTDGKNSVGRLLIKLDSALPIAGSVKARGGIYEVLKHTETLAFQEGILTVDDDYSTLADKRDFFSRYSLHVGSTGNLGLSVGIMGSKIGYRVTVHMSADAKQWKKDLLRSHGVDVVEYQADYSAAVMRGRDIARSDPMSYFIDDEDSADLFLGYAVAASRLKKQLDSMKITVDSAHPLFVYMPCGVGGAPGGITFGLKHVFGNNAHCFLIEPVNAPCMLTALTGEDCMNTTGEPTKLAHISEYGLSGVTIADGLAVGRASYLVYSMIHDTIDGEFTVDDDRLIPYLQLIHDTEGVFVELSAASALCGFEGMLSPAGQKYIEINGLQQKMHDAVHILWATGGGLVPDEEKSALLKYTREWCLRRPLYLMQALK